MAPLEYVLSGFEKRHINIKICALRVTIFDQFSTNLLQTFLWTIPWTSLMGDSYYTYIRFEDDLGLGSEESLF